jgi:4-alpha-glucanotransferase
MRFVRSSGILLHPTSLPGRWGIGDLGAGTYQLIDFLAAAGQQLWQVLPLNPTGYGDSPYQSLSVFAGNPLLISIDMLLDDGLLRPRDLPSTAFAEDYVDYGAVIACKTQVLRRSFAYFQRDPPGDHAAAFAEFCRDHADWLDEYALFIALKEAHNGAPWYRWEPELATRQPQALDRWKAALAEALHFQCYVQYLFFRQWSELKSYANGRGIRIIGDMPIFLAHDSADLWTHRELFLLDDQGQPTAVAGAPPDRFRAAGQVWGNPLPRWEQMAASGFGWWLARIRAMLRIADIVRLDHFRGFEASWQVAVGETTAINGRWVPGPGAALFATLERAFGPLPIIAEDLGVITPAVDELREAFGFPGMKVLQWAFTGDSHHPFLPHNYQPHCVVYTGTHDYDTTLGWFRALSPERQAFVLRYLGSDGSDLSWDFMRLALASVAEIALLPLQDVLRLGSEARLNLPGSAAGNWRWRYRATDLDSRLAEELHMLTALYGRTAEAIS